MHGHRRLHALRGRHRSGERGGAGRAAAGPLDVRRPGRFRRTVRHFRGRDERLKRNLLAAFTKYALASPAAKADWNVTVAFAGATDPINGEDPANIVNRTRTGAGAQMELSTALRKAMFGDFSSAARRRTTAGVPSPDSPYADHFWNGFVNAVREAIKNRELGLDSF